MKFFTVATIFFAAAIAAPTDAYPPPPPPPPAYSIPASGGSPPQGTVPPTGNKPPGGSTPAPAPAPAPGNGNGHGHDASSSLCPAGLFSNVQCCATDVLGVADLDCHTPSSAPKTSGDFQKVCAAVGQRPRCCVLPILGLGVLCTTPVGAQ